MIATGTSMNRRIRKELSMAQRFPIARPTQAETWGPPFPMNRCVGASVRRSVGATEEALRTACRADALPTDAPSPEVHGPEACATAKGGFRCR